MLADFFRPFTYVRCQYADIPAFTDRSAPAAAASTAATISAAVSLLKFMKAGGGSGLSTCVSGCLERRLTYVNRHEDSFRVLTDSPMMSAAVAEEAMRRLLPDVPADRPLRVFREDYDFQLLVFWLNHSSRRP